MPPHILSEAEWWALLRVPFSTSDRFCDPPNVAKLGLLKLWSNRWTTPQHLEPGDLFRTKESTSSAHFLPFPNIREHEITDYEARNGPVLMNLPYGTEQSHIHTPYTLLGMYHCRPTSVQHVILRRATTTVMPGVDAATPVLPGDPHNSNPDHIIPEGWLVGGSTRGAPLYLPETVNGRLFRPNETERRRLRPRIRRYLVEMDSVSLSRSSIFTLSSTLLSNTLLQSSQLYTVFK